MYNKRLSLSEKSDMERRFKIGCFSRLLVLIHKPIKQFDYYGKDGFRRVF
jgi:hypothetical protein